MGGLRTMLNIVPTFDGTEALKNNCRRIKGEYYEMGRQCFMMSDGQWHRINNGKIAFDHEAQKWVLLSAKNLVQGVVDIKKDKFILGYYSRNNTKNLRVYTLDKGTLSVINEDVLKKSSNIIESEGDGNYYTKDFVKQNPKVLKKRILKYDMQLNYSAGPSINSFSRSFYAAHPKPTKSPKNSFYQELDNIKFGFEFETWNGTIPERMIRKAGLIPLRDGSLNHEEGRSYEYATIPFSGIVGLRGLEEGCKLLTRYTEISPMCSTHVHISGYKPTKEFVVGLYLLIKKLEKHLYALFPSGFEDTSSFKGKNYCGKLPNIELCKSDTTDQAFAKIYAWLVGNPDRFPFTGFNIENHPADPGDHSKWNIQARYFLLNFIPFIWGRRCTLEFRLHPPTLNPTKTINWLFIANAILKYVDIGDWRDIYSTNKMTLERVVSNVYSDKLADYLNAYMLDLKTFRKKLARVNDYQGVLWCEEDARYTFEHGGISNLIE